MYKNFFGLKDSPFNVSPDPRYICWTRTTQEALSSLTYGIQSRKGFILLTGEVGTGKTTLLNRLLDWLREQDVATAFVFNSQLQSVSQLFDFMMADFEIPCESRLKSHVLLKLNQWLLDRYRAGKTTVLIVDEAQNLSDQMLEEIRLLTNLETSREKLLQIVLSGQPELDEKLKRPQLRQLRQRIVLRCRTVPLTLAETYTYINERLRIAGANGQPVFSNEAIGAVHHYSQGIPRVVNLLCEHSLINSFAEEIKPVPAPIVEEIAREFELDEISPTAPPLSWSRLDKVPAEPVEALLEGLGAILRRTERGRSLVELFRERKP
jgi:general secretion pathway protein A